jgi:hypothetical protein
MGGGRSKPMGSKPMGGAPEEVEHARAYGQRILWE